MALDREKLGLQFGVALVGALALPCLAQAQPAPDPSGVTAPPDPASQEPSRGSIELRRTGRFFAYTTLALAVGTGVGSGSLAWRLQGGDAPALANEIRGYAIGLGVTTVALAGVSVALFALCPPEDPDPERGSRALPWGLYVATGLALVPVVVGMVWAGTGRAGLQDPSQHPDPVTTDALVSRVFYGESIAVGFGALAIALGTWSAIQTEVALGARTRTSYPVHFAAAPTPGGGMLAVGGWL